MTIILDAEGIRAIASACQKSGETIQAEAANMNSQMMALEQAIQGDFPVGLEDKFVQWKALFAQLSEALTESNTFLTGVATSVDEMIARLRQS